MTRRIVVILAVLSLLGAAELPERGSLRTRDGRHYEGRTTLADGDILIVTPHGAEPVAVPLTELKSATLRPVSVADPEPNRRDDETAVRIEPRTDLKSIDPPAVCLVLRDGSVVCGDLRSLDERGVTLMHNAEPHLLKPAEIARVLFSRSLPEGANTAARDQVGAILEHGDFFEGEFRSFADGRVTISSVLFGNRVFTAGKELLAIVYGETKKADAKFILKCGDGSVVRCRTLHVSHVGATAEDGAGEKWRFEADEIQEIRGGADE